ncbi:MAG: methylamine dehydrogenase heavy chain, partial [Planctomycetota bacterium]
MKMRLTVFLIISLCNLSVLAELPIDKVGQVKTLPQNYPDHWIIVSDIAFANMLDGKVIVLDAEEDSHRNQYKGMFGASSIASMTVARSRPEMYVYETYYSRGSRGVRTDVLTIYDKATLRPTGEIVIPGNKRAGGLPSDHMMHLIDNEKLLLLFNFTPAASISVIDIVNRKILNEINLPACSLIYPTGKRGFSSMCSDASMISYQLDNNGQVKNKTKTGSFFD